MLYTQNTRARASFCSTAYTYILKFPEPGSAPARQRILVYSKCQGPGWFLLDSVYLYTQISRSQARSCSAAYTVYSKNQSPGLLLFGSIYLYTQIPRTWAVSQMKAYTVYSKNQSSGLLLLDSVYCELRPIPDRQLLDAQLYFLL